MQHPVEGQRYTQAQMEWFKAQQAYEQSLNRRRSAPLEAQSTYRAQFTDKQCSPEELRAPRGLDAHRAPRPEPQKFDAHSTMREAYVAPPADFWDAERRQRELEVAEQKARWDAYVTHRQKTPLLETQSVSRSEYRRHSVAVPERAFKNLLQTTRDNPLYVGSAEGKYSGATNGSEPLSTETRSQFRWIASPPELFEFRGGAFHRVEAPCPAEKSAPRAPAAPSPSRTSNCKP